MDKSNVQNPLDLAGMEPVKVQGLGVDAERVNRAGQFLSAIIAACAMGWKKSNNFFSLAYLTKSGSPEFRSSDPLVARESAEQAALLLSRLVKQEGGKVQPSKDASGKYVACTTKSGSRFKVRVIQQPTNEAGEGYKVVAEGIFRAAKQHYTRQVVKAVPLF